MLFYNAKKASLCIIYLCTNLFPAILNEDLDSVELRDVPLTLPREICPISAKLRAFGKPWFP